MINFIPVIIAIIIAAVDTGRATLSAAETVLALGACAVFISSAYLFSSFLASEGLRRLGSPGGAAGFAPRLAVLKRMYWFVLLAEFAVLQHVFAWASLLPENVESFPLAGEVFRIAPFFAAFILGSVPLYRLESFIRTSSWTRGGYIRYQLRQSILPIVPYLLLSLVSDIFSGYEVLKKTAAVYPLATAAATSVFLPLVFVGAPLFLRFLFPARELESGSLKQRLDDLAAKAGVRVRKIFVWITGGGNIINACVVGAAGFLRYIFLTDSLKNRFSEKEIESVFAHELAHAKARHILVFLMLILTFFFGLYIALVILENPLKTLDNDLGLPQETTSLIFTAAVLVLFWWKLFGAVSRMLEQQADLVGMRLAGDVSTFVMMLEKLAALAGNVRLVKGWRHHSIAHRARFLLRAHFFPETAERFERKLRTIILVLLAFFLLTVAGFSWAVVQEVSMPEREILNREASYHFYEGPEERFEAIERIIDRIAAVSGKKAAAREAAYWAAAYFGAGFEAPGDKLLEKAWKLDPSVPLENVPGFRQRTR